LEGSQVGGVDGEVLGVYGPQDGVQLATAEQTPGQVHRLTLVAVAQTAADHGQVDLQPTHDPSDTDRVNVRRADGRVLKHPGQNEPPGAGA